MSHFHKFCMILGEFIGTFMLLFFGCMMQVPMVMVPTPLMRFLLFGFVVMMVIQTVGHVSYAIINPAVTIAAVTNNLISLKMGIIYAITQCFAAAVGYGSIIALSPESMFSKNATTTGICMTLPHKDLSPLQSFLIEFLLTFALVCMVCGVWDPRNKKLQDSAPLKVGLTVVGLSLAGDFFTGASMNPARSFGPALWNWNWESHWIYWAGPLLGGLTASIFYKNIFQRNLDLKESGNESNPLKEDKV